jgi:intein/homing endonuclease
MHSSILDIIKQVAIERKLSHAKIALLSGLGERTINRLFTSRDVKLSTVERVSMALGIKITATAPELKKVQTALVSSKNQNFSSILPALNYSGGNIKSHISASGLKSMLRKYTPNRSVFYRRILNEVSPVYLLKFIMDNKLEKHEVLSTLSVALKETKGAIYRQEFMDSLNANS